MATSHNVSKPQRLDTPEELMRQGEQSTKQLAWLQDYLMDWRALRNTGHALIKKQELQARYDTEAHDALEQMCIFATTKIVALTEAYDKQYELHMKLMDKILRGDE